jgi:protein-disulfide isomerase
MNKVAWIIFGAAIVLILGGLVVYSRLSNPGIDVGSVNVNALIGANDQNGQVADHTLGKTDSKVIFIEYGDFQCPSCGGAHPQVKQIMEEYDDRVLFIFRNLPLTSIHPNARAAAAAVEAAGLQGKYWEMHDLVFENQNDWSNLNTTDRTNTFASYAQTLTLNKDQFLSDLDNESVKKKIAYDEALFKSTGFKKSTPTFVLNGSQLDTATSNALVQGSTTEVKALLDQALGE